MSNDRTITSGQDLLRHRYLLWNFVRSDLKQRYVGSSIGLFWSVINPLLLIGLYTFVFSIVLGVNIGGNAGIKHYGVFLFSGMLPWLAFNEAVQKSSTVFLEQRDLVKQVNFPNILLPLYVVVSSFIHELIALAIFAVILLVIKQPPSLTILGLATIFPLQLLMTFGFALIVSSINVFFRDTSQIANAVLLIWFFATPIVYPIEAVPLSMRSYFYINPLTPLIDVYRALIFGGPLHTYVGFIYFSVFTFIVFLTGVQFFRRLSPEFADML